MLAKNFLCLTTFYIFSIYPGKDLQLPTESVDELREQIEKEDQEILSQITVITLLSSCGLVGYYGLKLVLKILAKNKC